MKHVLFLSFLTMYGVCGSTRGPFIPLAVYYLYAVLRPQFIWAWSLPADVPWSSYVAIPAICTAVWGGLSNNTGSTTSAYFSSPAHKWLIGFGAWIGVTYLTAMSPETSYPYVLEYAKIFALMIVGMVAIRTLHEINQLLMLVNGALIYIAYEMNAYYFQAGYTFLYRLGYGGLDNNGAGLMIAMGLPWCIYKWDSVSRWWRWGYLAAVPLIVHAVLMSFSRGAMLASIIVLPLVVWRIRHRKQLLTLCSIFAFAILPLLAGAEIRERFFSIQSYEQDDSANSRFNSWAIGLRIASDNPIFGVGVRNSNLLTYGYGADMKGRTIHSQYLQIAADSGFVAVALYIGAMVSVWLLLNRARAVESQLDDSTAAELHLACNSIEGGLAIFCVGAMFLSLEVFELPYLLLLLGAQLPLALRERDEANHSSGLMY